MSSKHFFDNVRNLIRNTACITNCCMDLAAEAVYTAVFEEAMPDFNKQKSGRDRSWGGRWGAGGSTCLVHNISITSTPACATVEVQ